MRIKTALPTKKLYDNKSLSSRIFFGWRGQSARFEKTVEQNKPIFARRKTDLKRGSVPKKAYAYKAPFWPSSAQTALVMQRCKHRRKFCFVVLPLPKKFFDIFWEPCSSRRLGLVPSAQSFRAATSEHTTPRRNPVMRPLSRNGSTPYYKFNVRQKSTGNFYACTLALYHSYLHKSIEIQTFVCIFLL